MRAFVVGTAGHVDHGKTELVRALTGVDTDRWEEEKQRGLTIDLGFAPLHRDGETEIGVVDVPGHEDFVKNMLAGATGVDLLLLVVAADEGPMPQTREHLTIAHLLGVDQGVVALSKVDRVEEGFTELAREAVEEELRRVLGHARWPVVPVSPVEGTGVERVRSAVLERAGEVAPRPEDDLFRLPVDRSFTVGGVGTVVTGTAWSGSVAVGERVRVLPGGGRHRVRSLQVHGEDRDRVPAGRRCALALAGIDPDQVPRGAVVVTGEAWRSVRRLGARLVVPPHVTRTVDVDQRVRVYLGTREVMARVDLEDEALLPGQEGWARLRLEEPLVARARDRFIVRFYSPVTTLAGGRVAELEPGGAWQERTGEWRRVIEGEPPDAFGAAVRLQGGAGLTPEEAPMATGLTTGRIARLPGGGGERAVREGGRWFSPARLAELRQATLEQLGRLHRKERRASAVSLQGLRSALEETYASPLVERAVDELAREGRVVVEGPRVRLPSHRPDLTPEEESLKEELCRRVEEGGLEPPMVSELEQELGVDGETLHDLLRLLLEEGRLVPVSREIYLPPEREERLRRKARDLLGRCGRAGAAEFKDLFGVTRRYLIPYLEHLDSTGLTRRTGDGRVLVQDAADVPGRREQGEAP